MKFSIKTFICLVFIVIAILGYAVVKSPADHLSIFSLSDMWYIIGTSLGVTIVAKSMQKAFVKNARFGYLELVKKLWGLIDPTQGVIWGIVSFVLAVGLYAYRVPIVTIELLVSYQAVFMGYYSAVNVIKKNNK